MFDPEDEYLEPDCDISDDNWAMGTLEVDFGFDY